MKSLPDFFRYSVHVAADKKRKRKERKIVWTTKAPHSARLGPQDIMGKPEGISDKAKAATSHADLWELFFTPEMQAKIVAYTNTKIQEDISKKAYTKEDLRRKSHIKPTDEVWLLRTYSTVYRNIFRCFYPCGSGSGSQRIWSPLFKNLVW
jgi:hypothetical protein